MPSYGARHTIGVTLKSNNDSITSTDWRANRLVEAAVKAAALAAQVPASIRINIQRTIAAYEHAFVRLLLPNFPGSRTPDEYESRVPPS